MTNEKTLKEAATLIATEIAGMAATHKNLKEAVDAILGFDRPITVGHGFGGGGSGSGGAAASVHEEGIMDEFYDAKDALASIHQQIIEQVARLAKGVK